MASRRDLYARFLARQQKRKPPPSFGEAGPPIPGVGQVQQQRIREANRVWQQTHPAVARDGPVRHQHEFQRSTPRQPPPTRYVRRRRNSRSNDDIYARRPHTPQVN